MLLQENENEVLIQKKESTLIDPVGLYIMAKNIPYLFYLLLSIIDAPTNLQVILIGICLVAEFYITQNISGLQLVGLKWTFNLSTLRIEKYSKPEPFVPNSRHSSIFWSQFFISCAIWIIIFCITMFISSLANSIICLIAFALEVFNLNMFMSAQQESKQKIEANLLSSMKDDNVQFEFVPDDENVIESHEETPQQLDNSSKRIDPIHSIPLPPPINVTEENEMFQNTENETQLNNDVDDWQEDAFQY